MFGGRLSLKAGLVTLLGTVLAVAGREGEGDARLKFEHLRLCGLFHTEASRLCNFGP